MINEATARRMVDDLGNGYELGTVPFNFLERARTALVNQQYAVVEEIFLRAGPEVLARRFPHLAQAWDYELAKSLRTTAEEAAAEVADELDSLASALDTDMPSDSGYVERVQALAQRLREAATEE